QYDRRANSYRLTELNPETGTEFLNYSPGDKTVSSSVYAEASVAYNQQIAEKHGVSGMLVLIGRNALDGNAGSLSESLPKRNLGLSVALRLVLASLFSLASTWGIKGP